MDTRKYVQGQDYTLSGSGVTLSATSVTVASLTTPDGTLITMTDFGTLGNGVFEPETSREENFSFTGITQNVDGSATFTGVTRGLKFVDPYDQDLDLRVAHAGATTVRISNTAPFYKDFANKGNNETISQIWTFDTGATPIITDAPVGQTDAANKDYVDNVAVAGAPNGSTLVKGIYQSATVAEQGTATATGSTGARLVPENANLVKTSSGAGDENKIAVLDASGKFADGFQNITAANASTLTTGVASDAQSLHTHGNLIAKSVLTAKGDILTATAASTPSVVAVGADGTSPLADSTQASGWKWQTNPAPFNTTFTKDGTDASTTQNIAHGLGRAPKYVKVTWIKPTSSIFAGTGSYNGTTTRSIYIDLNGNINQTDSTYAIFFKNNTDEQKAVITVDATNVILTWTKVNSGVTGNWSVLLEAFA